MDVFSSLYQPIGVLLVLLFTTVLLIYLYATRSFSYWKKKGIPYIKPLPFVGNLKEVVFFQKHIGNVLHETYDSLKEQPFIGMHFFDQPVLFVKDLEFWKRILHKDFDYFVDRGFAPTKTDNIFWETLFARKGKYWKDLRTKLSPAFTSGKLKKFYILMEEKAKHLDNFFDEAVEKGMPAEMLDVCGKFTTDAIASVGFGMESNSLKNKNNEFRNVLKNVFVYSKLGAIQSIATFVNMPILSYIGATLMPPKLATFLRKAIWTTIEERKSNGVAGTRNDFLDLLIELQEKGNITEEAAANGKIKEIEKESSAINLEGDILIAQAFTFFSAGFETSATTMSFALYELAKNKQVQQKLRTSIYDSLKLHGGKLTYDSLQSCSYLDQVVSETLRMYPILPFLDRVCTRTYRVPGTDLILDKGVYVFTSLLGIHRDKTIYPNPENFDPERFSEENKQNRHNCAYMPFGGGPRLCIGMRLGLLQTKLGLAHLIMNYELLPCANTPKSIEFNLHSGFLIQPKNGIPLSIKRVK